MIRDGGTIVRPGVIAWDGIVSGGTATGHSSCEAVEQAIMAAASDAAPGEAAGLDDLLGELARCRLWLPLPGGAARVTDGSAVILPLIAYDGDGFVPAFTSVQRLGAWCDPRTMRSDPADASGPVRSGDPGWARDMASGTRLVRHVVVPFAGLASRLPPGLGIAVNPGTGVSLAVYPDAVEVLNGEEPVKY
jgi:hypothetical protein